MPSLGIKLSDIYYALFRHKWIVLGFAVVGFIVAVLLYLSQKPQYWSEAKLLIRYVVETKGVESSIGTQVKSPDYGGGETVINSELEILTSIDLCEEVASIIGAEKILGKGSNVTAAAAAIYKGLTVENPRRSNIIKIRFVHRDPSMCQIVLRQLVESYFKRHVTIHRAASGYDDVLSQEAQKLLVRIRQNEEELRNLKSKAGVISVEDARKNLSDQLSHLRQDRFTAEAELAELRIILHGYRAPTNETKVAASEPAVSPQKVADYKAACARLDNAKNKQFELLSMYTSEHPQVKIVREQVAEFEKTKRTMEAEEPALASLYIAHPAAGPVAPGETRPDPSRVLALETKIEVLTNQIASVRADVTILENLETSILDVQRKLNIDRQNYDHFAAGVEAARFDEVMGAAKMSNIQPVQTPSPPAPNVSQRLKIVAGSFFGILVVGLALVFGIEFLFDRTVRRPSEFDTKIHIPLFLSIPQLGLNGHSKLLPLPVPEDTDPDAVHAHIPVADLPSDHEAALKRTWATDHPLRPFIDGLRDRTLIHFDGDPHKPKLIGVTACKNGVGVTSLAAGLAGALSETGDGNVLLMNLNFEEQAVHPFYRGELTCGLSDALESEKRHSGMVLKNLYVATAGNPGDPEAQSLSKQLTRVVPKLRVSDYDYIVFDLPPTTPTTMTARLAGMMDLVIVVVESEKDTVDSVKQVTKLLSRSKGRVSAVLNKVNNPLPKWLQGAA